jgi:hypothetical protein
MAVTDDNGAEMLRLPVQVQEDSGGSGGDGSVTAEELLDLREGLAGGETTDESPFSTSRDPGEPVHPPGAGAGEIASTLDSEAVTDPVEGQGTASSNPLGIQAGPFPAVRGNRPEDVAPRYPKPAVLPGEEGADAHRQPAVVTTAWIRGQVEEAEWMRHWKYGGRITPAMINEYYLGLCKGYTQASIRRRLGISDTVWYEWGKTADKGSVIHRLFRRVVESGLGSIEGKVVDAWVSKVPDDWRAAEAFLKARFPADWNPSVQIDVKGTVQHQHEGRLSLDDDDLMEVANILQQQGVLKTGTPTPEEDVIDAEVVGEAGPAGEGPAGS